MALFERSIEVKVEEEGENLRIRGNLTDRRFGENLHGIEADMLISLISGTILEISGSMPTMPLEECAQGLDVLQELVGHRIKPGFTETVRKTVGSNRGCTHLSVLVMNMGNTSVQGRAAAVRTRAPDEESGLKALEASVRELGIIDSCVCWREDGPILRRWRERREKAR